MRAAGTSDELAISVFEPGQNTRRGGLAHRLASVISLSLAANKSRTQSPGTRTKSSSSSTPRKKSSLSSQLRIRPRLEPPSANLAETQTDPDTAAAQRSEPLSPPPPPPFRASCQRREEENSPPHRSRICPPPENPRGLPQAQRAFSLLNPSFHCNGGSFGYVTR
uniref:Uncharacterized protein n=1 Tax=Aegilops tauschii subsp. strangulata TaxID=200361 RepID=A0A453RAH9_AEGTS